MLVSKVGEGEIPDEQVDNLKRAIEQGFLMLSNVKQNKRLPAEVQRFMDCVSQALDQLQQGL